MPTLDDAAPPPPTPYNLSMGMSAAVTPESCPGILPANTRYNILQVTCTVHCTVCTVTVLQGTANFWSATTLGQQFSVGEFSSGFRLL